MKKKAFTIWHPFLYLIIINISILAISNIYFYHTFTEFYLEQSIKELAIRAKLFNREITEIRGIPLIGPSKPVIDNYAREVGKITESRVTIMNDLGYIVGDTLDLPYHSRNFPPRKELNVVNEGDIMMDIRKSTISDQNTLFVAVPLYINGEYKGVGRAARHISDIEQMRSSMIRDIIFFNVVMLLVLSAISYYISRRYTKQLRYINHKAQNLALGDFETRVRPPRVEEFRILADSFNFMAETVQNRVQTITSQRNNLNVIINSMTDALIAVDSQNTITDINPAAAVWLGADIDSSKGRKLHEVVAIPSLLQFIMEASQGGLPLNDDITFMDATGQNHVLRVKCSPINRDGNRCGGCVAVFYDVTQIQLANKMRRDFVTNVSHEIRTPLSVIQGSAEALSFSGLAHGREEQEFLDNIVAHSVRLTNLFSDILLLSRIEQNPQKIETEQYNLRTLLANAVTAVRSKTECADLPKFEITCSEKLPINVNASLLELALINLLDNAVKYGDGRRVEITVTNDAAECRISIKDYGAGIAAEHLERLTERFYRIDKARARQTGGTGLGLAIAKHIAVAHRGRLEIQSVLNEGSIFSLILPLNGELPDE